MSHFWCFVAILALLQLDTGDARQLTPDGFSEPARSRNNTDSATHSTTRLPASNALAAVTTPSATSHASDSLQPSVAREPSEPSRSLGFARPPDTTRLLDSAQPLQSSYSSSQSLSNPNSLSTALLTKAPLTTTPTVSLGAVPSTLSGYESASVNISRALWGVTGTSSLFESCWSVEMAAWSDWMYGPMTVETMTITNEWNYIIASDAEAKGSALSTVTATGGEGYATDYPFIGNPPPGCCGQCEVTVEKVEILWWPDEPASSGNTSIATDKTGIAGVESSRIVRGSTAVYKGTTLTSPTLYLEYTTAWGFDSCGVAGTVASGGLMPVPSTDLSRMLMPVMEHLTTNPWLGNITVPVNPQDFAGCQGVAPSESMLTTTINGTPATGDKCWPYIVLPTQFLALQPAWASCSDAGVGVYDPPQPLTPQSVLLPATTALDPTIKPSPGSTQPGPTASSTAPPTTDTKAPYTVASASAQGSKPAPSSDLKPTTGSSRGADPSSAPPGHPNSQSQASTELGLSTSRGNARPTVFSIGSESFTLTAVAVTSSGGKNNRPVSSGSRADIPASNGHISDGFARISASSVPALDVGGTTLTPGGPAATIDGTLISLGSSVLVVGSRTETFAAAETTITEPDGSTLSTTVDIGAAILSGLGQIGGTPVRAPSAPGGVSPTIAVGGAGGAARSKLTAAAIPLILAAAGGLA